MSSSAHNQRGWLRSFLAMASLSLSLSPLSLSLTHTHLFELVSTSHLFMFQIIIAKENTLEAILRQEEEAGKGANPFPKLTERCIKLAPYKNLCVLILFDILFSKQHTFCMNRVFYLHFKPLPILCRIP